MAIPALGSVFTLECLGDAPGGPRFLDGRTMDRTVGLARDFSTSGTQWALTRHAQDVVTLKCMGDIEGPRFLDGRTADQTVGLALNTLPPHSGTCWAVSEVADGVLTLRCLGHADGARFLDGRTIDGSVGLAPDTGHAFSGTRWRIRVTGKLVMVFCLGRPDGARFLDGRTGDQSVGLSETTADPFTGTRWYMIGDNDSFALKCLGTGGGGPWFLDGDTVAGHVRLVAHTGAPFSGTRWRFDVLDVSTGEGTLQCLGDIDGVRFLDGHTTDGTVALVASAMPALVGSATPALSGTRWRILTPCPLSTMRVPDAFEPVTVRVAQLTGSNDPEDRPVINDTAAWGAPGLDLGANCRHGDEVFLFLSDVVRDDSNNGPPRRDTDTVTWMNASALGGHEAEGYNFVLPHVPTSLPGWRYCDKCAVLFYAGDGDQGACAKGGRHSAAGLTFVVPSEPTDVAGQHEWRKCRKCKGMFFELFPDRGVCPAGGKHEAQGARWVLPFEDFAGSRQSNWRFCRWCRALFFAGDPAFQGACVADGNAFKLEPVLNGDRYDPFTVEGPIKETLQAETPTGAFSYDNRIYVFVWIADERGGTPPCGSYLVSKNDPSQPGRYREDLLFSEFHAVTKGFWQVAPWVVNNAEIPGLPSAQGDGLLMFGAGRETKWPEAETDAIHLAWMPLQPGHAISPSGGKPGRPPDTILYRARPSHPRVFHGKPWSDHEAQAVPLIKLDSQYTSLSVAWLAEPKRWILLYSKANNDQKKRSYAPSDPVIAHIGTTPWDWSPAIEIFNPCREQAYGCYMHWPGFETISQDVEPWMIDEPGWAYGAHLLNRFTKWDPSTRMLDIYYLLSLHRPYQAQVMFTRLHLP